MSITKELSIEDLMFLITDIKENTHKEMACNVYERRITIVDKLANLIKEKETPTVYTFTNIKTGETLSLYDKK